LIPWVVIFLMLSWMRMGIWAFASSIITVLAGVFASKSVRFPLILGGLLTAAFVVATPMGVL